MNEIGTLSEKSIHAKLKGYLEPNKEFHEVKVGRYIADIKRDNEIIEIQTKQFKNLLNKLEYYTKHNFDVTVVYPIVASKILNWVDPISNETVESRKSPYKGVIQDCFRELYWIIDYIVEKKIKFKIILIEAEQYKYLDGYGQNSKYRATKIDIVPTKVIGEESFCNVSDLSKFIPKTLEREWTAKDFVKHSKVNSKYYASGLKMLRDIGIIIPISKRGNTIIYRTNNL